MKRLLRTLCLVLLGLALFPLPALANSYSVESVDIDATVSSDGSLWVDEARTYAFDGSYNGIYWDVPRGTYGGRTIEPEILSVLAETNGESTVILEGADGSAGTFELSIQSDRYSLKIYWPAEDETVTFHVQYDLSELATRWSDVSELYWQYVPADSESDVEWNNVTCTVSLPMPDGGTATVGEDVRAWAHGPLDGEVNVTPNKVTFFSPGVGTAEFLEARIVFPSEWLADAPAVEVNRLDEILEEEAQWVSDANAKRRSARLVAWGFPGGMCLAGIGSVIASRLHKKHRVKKGPKTRFTDKYYRDVPTNDHPAVLGMLHRGGMNDAKNFSATLMRLVDQGRVVLDAVWTEREGKLGRVKREREWRMTRRDTVGAHATAPRGGSKAIDDAASDFLFKVVGDKKKYKSARVVDAELLGQSKEPYVLMSYFDDTAKTHPQAYQNGYERWSNAVSSAYIKRGFEADSEDDVVNAVLGLGDFALSVVFGVVGMLLGVPNLILCVAFVVWFGAGLFLVLTDEDIAKVTYTQEATDIRAQLEALKRWLTDFTRLEEAIPTDVVLWNRLLVMATVLGVADKVVKQLRIYAPELVEDPGFTAYSMYRNDIDGLDEPFSMLGSSIDSAQSTAASKLFHETSTSDVASSRDSSSSGSGGGFSGGGGGGFSGGGRGGAF